MKKTTEAAPIAAPEPTQIDAGQAADFASLASQAAELDAANAPPEQVPGSPGEPAPPAVDLAEELTGLVLAFSAMLAPAYPRACAIYTEETTRRAAGAVAAVCNKHGWLQGGIAGGWGEEIAAAAVLVPLGISTYQAARMDAEARRQADRPAPPEPAPASSPVPAGGGGFEAAIAAGAHANG